LRIEPNASPEEVAAIMAALEGVKRDRVCLGMRPRGGWA
jgi:hypothetical protein